MLSVLREQWRELGELFGIRFWIAIAFLGYAVAIGTASVARKVFVNVRRWSLLLFLLILSLLEIGLLFSFSYSPDTLLMLRDRIPALVYAAAAVGFGLAVASWFAYLVMGDPDETLQVRNWKAETKEDADPEEILSEIRADPLLRGVTFSGGEPFCQPGILARMARTVHSDGLDVVTYTGYLYEQLKEMAVQDREIGELLEETDILIDGPFLLAERDLSLLFRGSRNQRIINLKEMRASEGETDGKE